MKRTAVRSLLLAASGVLVISAQLASAHPGHDTQQWVQQKPAEQTQALEPQQHEQHEQKSHLKRGHWQSGGEEHQARRLKHLQEAAKYFGLSTQGKSAKQLHDELKAIRAADPAKWEKFKAAHKAKRLANLQEAAERHGIATKGKTARQICDELRKVQENGAKNEKK